MTLQNILLILFLFLNCFLAQFASSATVVRMSQEKDVWLDEVYNRHQLTAGSTFAFAKHFQDHMVLQQAPHRANIYGFSPDIGQKVIMQMITSSKIYYYTTTIEAGPVPGLGKWVFTLDPMKTSDSVNFKVESEAGSLALKDVLFGDVWLCSGQSNMQFVVSQMLQAQKEIADAHNYPQLRLMSVAMKQSATPLYDLIEVEEPWTSPNKGTVGGPAWSVFSAVCWLFGKAIHKDRGYPIGLVATDWGGTPVEAWSSPDALKKCGVESSDEEKSKVTRQNASPYDGSQNSTVGGPQSNSVLWNSMVNPMLGMTIYGAIWYQGEADASGPRMNKYNCTFPAMIADWRDKFNAASNHQTAASFPFGFVQLAPNRPDATISVGFPDIRWHQTADFGYVPNPMMPNTFMAVAMDLPDFNSLYGAIHPRDKEDVGTRLALSGLYVAYNKKTVDQGPFPKTAYEGTDNTLVIDYGSQWTLQVKNVNGFELLCSGSSVTTSPVWVSTVIVSSNNTTVSLHTNVCQEGYKLLGLRYAWRESPCPFKACAVYSSINQLPGPSFLAYASPSEDGRLFFQFDKQVTV